MPHDGHTSQRPGGVSPAALTTTAIGLAGLLSLAVAMGFGRFAFTPLLPLMIRDGQLVLVAGGWVATANYIGYLVGALSAAPLARDPLRMARLALGLTLLLMAAMALPLGAWGWAAVRGLAGMASAWAFVATSIWCLGALAQRAPAQGPSGWSSGLYAGVGLGIMLTGLYTLGASAAGAGASALWLQLALLAALLLWPVWRVLRQLRLVREGVAGEAPSPDMAVAGSATPVPAEARAAPSPHAKTETAPAVARISLWSPTMRPLVVGYTLFGFGYILPATFLPELARQLVPDPRLFGLAWPAWGLAATLSALLAVWWLRHASRLQVWAVTQALMGIGALAPSLWLSGWTIGLSAVLVGGTFMVMTLAAVQEARVRGGAAVLPRMTTAFALGQIAGPVLPNALVSVADLSTTQAMNLSLQVAALSLLASAAWLWRADRARVPA